MEAQDEDAAGAVAGCVWGAPAAAPAAAPAPPPGAAAATAACRCRKSAADAVEARVARWGWGGRCSPCPAFSCMLFENTEKCVLQTQPHSPPSLLARRSSCLSLFVCGCGVDSVRVSTGSTGLESNSASPSLLQPISFPIPAPCLPALVIHPRIHVPDNFALCLSWCWCCCLPLSHQTTPTIMSINILLLLNTASPSWSLSPNHLAAPTLSTRSRRF